MRLTDGSVILMMKDNDGKVIPKPKSQYGVANYWMLTKNDKAKYILVCGLGTDKFNRISGYTIAKQIWDTLFNIHEATLQVRKFRIARL